MLRGLYDTTFISVLPKILDGETPIESLRDVLPIDILEDIESYLSLSPMKRLYKSIRDGRNYNLIMFFMNNLPDGRTIIIGRALVIAASLNNLKLVQGILNEGSYDDDFLNDAMIEAAKNGNRKIIDILIEKGADDVNRGIEAATKSRDMNLLQFFIEKGAHVFSTGLAQAIKLRDQSLIDFFLENGIEDSGWNLVLKVAIIAENRDFINRSILMGANDWRGALRKSIKRDNEEFINFFMEKVDQTSSFRNEVYSVALAAAIMYENVDLINYFIKLDQFNDVELPLKAAAKKGNIELIKYFIEIIDSYDYYSSDDLKIALTYGRFNAIDVLSPIPEGRDLHVYAYGPSVIHYVKNAFLTPYNEDGMKREIDIGELLPLAKQGYMMPGVLSLILLLNAESNDNLGYYTVNSSDHPDHTEMIITIAGLIKTTFGNMPSLYAVKPMDTSKFITVEHCDELFDKVNNTEELTSFDVLGTILKPDDPNGRKYYHKNSLTLKILNVLTDINRYKTEDLDNDVLNALSDPEVLKQTFRESFILHSLIGHRIEEDTEEDV